MKLTKKQLQAELDKCEKYGEIYHEAYVKIHEHCRAVYGVEPGDVDCDEFIDAIVAGGAPPSGMSADELDTAMRESMGLAGLSMPSAKDQKE